MQANTTENNGAPEWWKEYISSDPLFSELQDLRTKALEASNTDYLPKAGRKRQRINVEALQARVAKEDLFRGMETTGEKLVAETNILKLHTSTPQVLDLCMAPGGFVATVEKALPKSIIDTIILPTPLGGYNVLNPHIFRYVMHTDKLIYNLVDEGVVENDFETELYEITRPFLGGPYDLIFCGCAPAKYQPREDYQSYCEAIRLSLSQLVFALDRLKPGGSLVLLLDRIDAWHTVCILHALSRFSEIQVYKHPEIHATKSSFYLVAKNVNLDHEDFKHAINNWRDLWTYIGFEDTVDAQRMTWRCDKIDQEKNFKSDFEQFGPRFLELARPVWKIQATAMRRASFNQSHKP
ncbi:uncharacterized protein KD926_009476 [Aspergillus affinis]|uniref:uncharacterized protein n=1 Tax=Aspergillus affinis TaxID=1070780 RepID=UPI0022FEB17D|nr:uncharacterized protein KD926_009476 [Aspergillus affinis]KAI9039333.1 hypothetical protein KD926_009476 [Aspergillus affinis]